MRQRILTLWRPEKSIVTLWEAEKRSDQMLSVKMEQRRYSRDIGLGL